MASQTLSSVADIWPAGTTVSVYAKTAAVWDGQGTPPGSAVTTAAVASDGSVTFTGLADDTAYIAYASSRIKRFRTPSVSAGGGGGSVTVTGGFAALVGVGAPSATAPDGSTYYEQDATGQTVAQWVRASGAWAKVLGPAPYVALTRSAVQSIPNNISAPLTAISWDVERADDSGMHDPAAPTRITFARTGLYAVMQRIRFAANATGTRWNNCVLNGMSTGTTIDIIQGNASTVSAATPWPSRIAFHRRFTAGDFIEFGVFQNSGAALDLFKENEVSPELTVSWLAP